MNVKMEKANLVEMEFLILFIQVLCSLWNPLSLARLRSGENEDASSCIVAQGVDDNCV